MPTIGPTQFREVYRLSKLVDSGEISEREAGLSLEKRFGMNYSSAMGYLRKRRQLLAGETYTRTVNLAATRFFLEKIYEENGQEGLSFALKAVRGHIKYYQDSSGVGTPGLEQLVKEFDARNSVLEENREEFFQREVAASLNLSSDARRGKLPPADNVPAKLTVVTKTFARNPHVVAEVLHRANGICEMCKNPAPFTKKANGQPYLEVHHKVRLAHGGFDSVANAEALCPNCHRQKHFG